MFDLSFVIPAYNVEKYIERCLNSIFSQNVDHNRYEVIVIDDGSTDGTLDVLTRMEQEHDNIRVVSQENNGPSVARNKGIELSKGKYIWFVDSDDYIEECSMHTLFTLIRDSTPDTLFFSVKVFNVDGSSYSETIPAILTGKLMDGKQVMKKGFTIGSACMGIWKREYLNTLNLRFLPHVNWGEDSLFVFSATLQAKKVLVINDPLYVYERKNMSLTTVVVSAEIFQKRKMGDVKIAQSLRELSINYRIIDPEISVIADGQLKKILLGLVYSLFINRLKYKKEGVVQKVISKMKKEKMYPLEGSFENWKKNLFCFFLNHVF